MIELERQLLAVADELVAIAVQPDPIGLETMPQAGLRDPLTLLELMGQANEIAVEVRVDQVDEGGDDPTEQQAAEAGWRGGRQHRDAEGDPAGGRDRARVEHFQLGQDHEGTVPVDPPARPIENRSDPRSERLHVLAEGLAEHVGGFGHVVGLSLERLRRAVRATRRSSL